MPGEKKPTILDLHVEQTRQAIILDQLSSDTKEIKEVLVGSDKRKGLVVDVDRLKQANRLTKAIFWVLFTTIVGAAASAALLTK